MLKEVKSENGSLKLIFDLKNKGKFRYKEMPELPNPYSRQLNKQEIEICRWYLEWMVTYRKESKEGVSEDLLIDEVIEVGGKKFYPYELPALYRKALEAGLVSKEEAKDLLDWVCESNETIEEKFGVDIWDDGKEVSINRLRFQSYRITLPSLVYLAYEDKNHKDRKIWIEVFLNKQQYAYGVQPFVFLCISQDVFQRQGNEVVWEINRDNVSVISDLLKVFASISDSYRHEICKILETILDKQ